MSDFVDNEMRCARKRHTCNDCRCVIQPGQKYLHQRIHDDGGWRTWRRCETCQQWHHVFDTLDPEIYDQLWPELPTVIEVAKYELAEDWTDMAEMHRKKGAA